MSLGAFHGQELTFVFHNPTTTLSSGELGLADAMVGYWTRFADEGNPNSEDTPNWPRSGASQRFQSLVPGTSKTATGFGAEHHCSLFGG